MTDTATRPRRRVDGPRALVIAAVVLIAALVAFLLLVGWYDDEEPVTRDIDVGVSEEAFAALSVGDNKEAVLQALLPAEPMDSTVLAEYETRIPETPAAECVYYESEGGAADDLYRLCFADDELVDKTVILPPEDGVTGDDGIEPQEGDTGS